MNTSEDRKPQYRKDSLTLVGAGALGTVVMIGAGIFALTGQMAQMTGSLFPLAFLSAALIVSFSTYSYIKISNAYPSAGGIAIYLKKAYGRTLTTAFHALLMYFSMVIAQSFLARTFGAHALRLFQVDDTRFLVPISHSHFEMPGGIQKHTLVYTVVLGLLLTIFFDLSRIAALGIIFYLIMDIGIRWGILRHLRREIGARSPVLIGAIVLGLIVLSGFRWIKISTDLLVVGVADAVMLAIVVVEALFLRHSPIHTNENA